MTLYYTIEEFSQLPENNSSDVVEGIFPVGITLLFATQKTGKSLLSRDIAINLSNNSGDIFGFHIHRSGNIVYFALDDSKKTLHSRFDSLVHLDKCFIVTNDCLEEAEVVSCAYTKVGYMNTIVEEIIRNHGEVSMVIIDTFEKIRKKDNCRDYSSEVEELHFLKNHAEKHSYNLLLVHHATKYSNGDPMSQAYGSNGLLAEVDVIIRMDRTEDSDVQRLTIRGNTLADHEILIRRNEDFTYTLVNSEYPDLIIDAPEKAYVQIIKYFTRKSQEAENGQYTWSGEYQDFIADLDLDIDPRGLGKLLHKYEKAFLDSHITYEIKRKTSGMFATISIARDCDEECRYVDKK